MIRNAAKPTSDYFFIYVRHRHIVANVARNIDKIYNKYAKLKKISRAVSIAKNEELNH
jgi:hypothetical protein